MRTSVLLCVLLGAILLPLLLMLRREMLRKRWSLIALLEQPIIVREVNNGRWEVYGMRVRTTTPWDAVLGALNSRIRALGPHFVEGGTTFWARIDERKNVLSAGVGQDQRWQTPILVFPRKA